MYTKPTRTLSNHLYEKLTKDWKFLPKGVWVDKNKKVRESDLASVDSWCRGKYALKGVSNVPLDLPPSYREQVDRHIDQLMDKGLGDVVEKAINGDNSDFEKFLETAIPIQLKKPVPKTEEYLVKSNAANVQKLQKAKENYKNRRPILPLKKKKDACRCNKCMAKSLGKAIKELQTPKTVNNVDPVKEARRQARKARMQVAKLKEAAREARRQTVEVKRRVDPYAAVKARKIQEEQEERKFKVQNEHNGLQTSVRVMSGYSKPNTKRRRR